MSVMTTSFIFIFTQVLRDIHFVRWDEMTLSVKTLCDGDYDRPIRVYALEDNGGDIKMIGHFETTLNELKNPQNHFLLIDSELQVGL